MDDDDHPAKPYYGKLNLQLSVNVKQTRIAALQALDYN